MGVPVLPATTAVRSMVRLPDSGWDKSLPSSVLDLSRSSGLAATVHVGPAPFLTGTNIFGTPYQHQGNAANSVKLCDKDPYQQIPEIKKEEVEGFNENAEESPISPKRKRNPKKINNGLTRKGKAISQSNGKSNITRKRRLSSSGTSSLSSVNGKSKSITKTKSEAYRSNCNNKLNRLKRQKTHLNIQEQVPTAPQQVTLMKVVSVAQGNNAFGHLQPGQLVMVSPSNPFRQSCVPGGVAQLSQQIPHVRNVSQNTYSAGIPNGSQLFQQMPRNIPYRVPVNMHLPSQGIQPQGPQMTYQQKEDCLLRLKQESAELRVINSQLKQRIINYQNLFKDKQRLQTVISTLFNQARVQ